MSQRRCSLLRIYCCRRLSAMNLSNAEVNGIQSRKAKSTNIPAGLLVQMNATHPTPNGSPNKKLVNKVIRKHIHIFRFLIDEAEAAEDQGVDGQAESLYNQLIRYCKRNLSVDQYETAIAYNHLALLHLRRGRFESAKPLFE